MVPDLELDPAIRVWVVYPILAVMVLVGLARHYVTVLLAPAPPRAGSARERTQQQFLAYGGALAAQGHGVPAADYAAQVAQLAPAMRAGAYLADPDAPAASPMMSMTDPRSMETMIAGVKSQVFTYVPQTVLMTWVSTFFGGIVVMKLPFPLTTKFKDMLQSGIPTQDLDVRWVSSISWYILLLMGAGSVFALLLGEDNQAALAQADQQSTPGLAPGVDARKLFASLADSLELVRHESVLTGVEERVLALE